MRRAVAVFLIAIAVPAALVGCVGGTGSGAPSGSSSIAPATSASIEVSIDLPRNPTGWTPATAPAPQELKSVAVTSMATNGRLVVAAGYGTRLDSSGTNASWPGYLWWSIDGRTWTAARLDIEDPQVPFVSVAWAKNRFVAALSTGPFALLTSEDGKTWRHVPALDGTPEALSGIAAGPTGFLAYGARRRDAGGAPAAWWSDDGMMWQPAEMPGNYGHVASVALGREGFVAVGSVAVPGSHETRPAAWTSADGREWSAAVVPQPESGSAEALWQLDKVVSFGAGYLGVGRDNTDAYHARPTVWLSSDGRTWETMPLEIVGGRAFETGDLAVVGGRVLLSSVVNEPFVVASADGRTWTEMKRGERGVAATTFLEVGDRVLVGSSAAPGGPLFYVGPADVTSLP